MLVNKSDKIFVAGHKGLVGKSIINVLKKRGFNNILVVDKKKVNLTDQKLTFNFLKKHKPKFVFISAAIVGGIHANNIYRAKFLYENLAIQNNIIHGCYLAGIKRLIFLGSSCIYPRNSKQPIKEKYLLSGSLEKTNEPYAIAKIAGVKLCETYNYQYKTDYKCIMPCNAFGPGDNYHKQNSHFLPALIRKIHEIKIGKEKNLKLWGTGKPKREFIYVEDLADACVYFMNKKTKESLINIGTGKDYTILETAKLALKVLNVKCKIIFDQKKIDGTPRKVLDISLARNLGWKSKTSLKEGLHKTYNSYLKK